MGWFLRQANKLLSTHGGRFITTVIYFVFVALYLLVAQPEEQSFWNWGRFADGIGVTSALFAFAVSLLNFVNDDIAEKRSREKVQLVLQHGAYASYTLPIILQRGEVSRAEVLGYIGLIPAKKKQDGKPRYKIDYLSSESFIKQIHQVKAGKQDIIILKCKADEYGYFDFDEMTKLAEEKLAD